MRRILIVLCAVLAALIVVPPILGSLLGWNDFRAARPDPGRKVEIRPGVSVNVLDSGRGEPVVLVHGCPGSAYDWKPLPQTLEERGCRVVRYDRVGYGYSSRRTNIEEHTIEANARELMALLDALGLEQVTLVGWSFGGGVSQMVTEIEPKRVKALALVGSIGPAFLRRKPTLFERIFFSKPAARWGYAVGRPARDGTALLSTAAFSPEPVAPWWVDQSLALISLPGTYDSMQAEGDRMEPMSVLHPEKIRTRTIVFHGADDLFVPASVGEDLHARISSSEMVMVPHGGHMLPVTQALLLGEKIAALAGCSK